MATFEATEVQVPGRSFATTVWRAGQGRPLVFLHGAGGLSPRDPALLRLADDFEVIAPVHPGFTRLEDLDELLDVHDLALYHDDLLEALGLHAVALAGHSFGGMVAAEVAAHLPARVDKLILVAPPGLWRDDIPMADLLSAEPHQIPGLLWADPTSDVAAETNAAMADPDMDPVDAAVLATRGITAATKYLWPIPDRGLSRRLYRIKAETLIVWGSEDRVVPAGYAAELSAAIPGSRVEMFDGAGHMVTYERLDDYCQAVRDFVAGG